jgi:hypothetical protein
VTFAAAIRSSIALLSAATLLGRLHHGAARRILGGHDLAAHRVRDGLALVALLDVLGVVRLQLQNLVVQLPLERLPVERTRLLAG